MALPHHIPDNPTQDNFDNLDLRTTGAEGRLTANTAAIAANAARLPIGGGAVVVWPGGSQFSNTLTVTHGLGRTPAAVVANCGETSQGVSCLTFTFTSTTFQMKMYNATSSPAAAATYQAWWIAY